MHYKSQPLLSKKICSVSHIFPKYTAGYPLVSKQKNVQGFDLGYLIDFGRTKFETLYLYFRFFLQQPANPDLLYIIFFCHSQLTISILLCLIFASKVSKTLFYFTENRKLSLYHKKHSTMK